MKFILAKKQEMTQCFDENGTVYPATLVVAEPNEVGLVRTLDKDKYAAAQLVLGKTKKEFRFENEQQGINLKQGDKIDVSVFSENDIVRVSGISKGKGFQGVVKRHGFKGGPRSHGQKHSEREPGSIGSTGPQRVFKGVRMGGRMGGDRITVKNLKILKIDKDTNQMLISGALPGKRGTLLEIRSL